MLSEHLVVVKSQIIVMPFKRGITIDALAYGCHSEVGSAAIGLRFSHKSNAYC
jgi:hypothetical protein